MIRTLAQKINKGKLNIFLLFLLCSFLAWTISKLSEVYQAQTIFNVAYTNVPDSLLLRSEVKEVLSAKVETSGFQLLGLALNPKTVVVDVKTVQNRNGNFVVGSRELKKQVESQLSSNISFLDINSSFFQTALYAVDSKKIKVRPNIDLVLSKNHILEGVIAVTPESVLVKGPANLLKKIDQIFSESVSFNEVSSDFSHSLRLQPIDSTGNVVMDETSVIVSGKVVRFSEKEIDIDIRPINVPSGYRLRMFPDHVSIICKAGVGRLKNIASTDFDLIVDYNDATDDTYLFVTLLKQPNGLFSVRLLQDRVEFVLEKL